MCTRRRWPVAQGFFKAFEDLPGSQNFPVDEPEELVSLALSHIYADCELQPITMDTVRSLVAFFRKYDMERGIQSCDFFLSVGIVLSTENLPEWITLADQHKLTSFLESCVSFAAEHLAEMSSPEIWIEQLLPTTNIQLVSPLSIGL